jgi:4,5-DOPA dioxygenase extradiol
MGLVHGPWTVLKHLYLKADAPVFQLSIDYTQPTGYHFKLVKALKKIREKDILIIYIGNIVHNFGHI